MAFSLADMLKEVSNPDTGREQIEYIRRDLIDSDANNFYQLSDIEGLADNIAFAGLQQPIRVRKNPDNDRYTIISGHRRRAAIELLAKDEPEKWQEVSCIVQQDTASPALQQLQLIFANSSTRKLTPVEISEQAVQVEKLLYQLKEEEGYEFPGRMRDHVSEVVGVSKTKIARLKVIRENLEEFWMPHFEDNTLHESTAYYLSQLSGEDQYVVYEYAVARYGKATDISCSVVEAYGNRLSPMVDLICPTEGIPCENMDNKKDATIRCGIYDFHPCGTCCASCHKLTSCRYACPKLADQIAHQKEEARKKRRQEKAAAAAAQAAKDAPIVEQIKNLWVRFGALRRGSSRSIKEVIEAVGNTFSSPAHQQYCDHEQGLKIDWNTALPYGSVLRHEVENLIKLADLFGCSLDYLLCRTDDLDPKPVENVSNSDTGWRTGNPEKVGYYAVVTMYDDSDTPDLHRMMWTGCSWEDHWGYDYNPETDGEILGWMPFPEVVGNGE